MTDYQATANGSFGSRLCRKIKIYKAAAFSMILMAVLIAVPEDLFAATPTYSFSQSDATADSVTVNWSFSNTDDRTFTDLSLSYGTNAVAHISTIHIPSVTDTSYTISGLTGGTIYYIRLEFKYYYNDAPDDLYTGSTSAIAAGTVPGEKPSGIRYDFEKSQKTLRISWRDIGCDYAITYQYQLRNRNGKILKDKETASFPVSFKNYYKQPYTFRVRAVASIAGLKYYGPWTNWKNIVPQPILSANTKKSRITKNGTMKLRWSKVYGASGYKIYISTKKDTGYKCVKTIKKGTVLSAEIKKFNKKKFRFNKNYYVKVAATTKNFGKSNLNYGLKLILNYK